jgi:hypothetical protein
MTRKAVDPEIDALRKIANVLEPLDLERRWLVIEFFHSKIEHDTVREGVKSPAANDDAGE